VEDSAENEAGVESAWFAARRPRETRHKP